MRRNLALVITIGARFLRSQSRDLGAIATAFALPIVIAGAMGFADQYANSTLAIGVVTDPGAGPVAGQLVSALERSPALSVQRYGSVESLRREVRTGVVVAGVEIPANYDDDLLAGRSGAVRVFGQDETSASTAAQADILLSVLGNEALVSYAAEHRQPGETVEQATARLRDAAPEVSVRRVTAKKASAVGGVGRFTAGMIIFFVFVSALFHHGAALRDDRRRGVVARMGVTPNPAWVVVAGELAGRLVLVALQAVVGLGVGALLFGIRWGDPLAVFGVVFVFATASLAAGLLVGASGRPMTVPETQMRTAGIVTLAGMLGGCFWPLALGPAWLETVAHVTPHAWANDILNELLSTDAGVAQVWPQLVVLCGFAVVLFAAALLVFRRRVFR